MGSVVGTAEFLFLSRVDEFWKVNEASKSARSAGTHVFHLRGVPAPTKTRASFRGAMLGTLGYAVQRPSIRRS